MNPIAVFYHCLFMHGAPPTLREHATSIVQSQMADLRESGLLDAASEMIVGINGGLGCWMPGVDGDQSREMAHRFIPAKAKIVWHGLASKAENLTLIEIEKWVWNHPGWNVLYFHSKGCTHDASSEYGRFSGRWRRCMMKRCVTEWRTAVDCLETGYDAVGCHWLTGMGTDKSQHFFAGNFWWATSDFLAKVPSMYLRDRIKVSGISNAESRYEAEVWIGNGPMPRTKDLELTHGLGQCP